MPYANLKQNDVVDLGFQLTESSDDATGTASPIDLTGDTVTLELYFTGNEDGDRAGTVPNYNGVEVDTYVDRESGRVSHSFGSDAFEYHGTYQIEFVVDDGQDTEAYPKVGYYTVEVDERLATITPGELDEGGSLTTDIDVAGFDLTNIGILNFNAVSNTNSEAGDLWFTGTQWLGDPDGNGGDPLGGGGGGGSGSIDIYDEDGQVYSGASLIRFLDADGPLDVSSSNPRSDEVNVTYEIQTGSITEPYLAFDTATQSELDTHAGTVDAHRTDENIQDLVNDLLSPSGTVDTDYDDVANTLTVSVIDDSITATQLADAAVGPPQLDTSNAPSDDYVAAWNQTANQLTWRPRGSGGSGTSGDVVVDEGGTFSLTSGGITGEGEHVAAREVVMVDVSESTPFEIVVSPDPNTTQPDADYDFDPHWRRIWRQSGETVFAEIEVFWVDGDDDGVLEDPGSDVTVNWVAYNPTVAGTGSSGGGADWTDNTTTVSQPPVATFTATNDAGVDVQNDNGDVIVEIDAQLQGDEAVLDTGDTFTAVGGGLTAESNTAARELVDVSVNEDQRFAVNVWPSSATQPDTDYYWDFRATRLWDQGTESVKVLIEVFWDEYNGTVGDPGAGNDVEFAWNATDPAVAASGSSGSLSAGSVGTTELAGGAVTTAKLADDAVTPAKLDSGESPNDGEVPEWDGGASRFIYTPNGSGGGGGEVSSSPGVVVDEDVTASGDGSSTTFTVSHSLGVTPAYADAVPLSKAASTDFSVQSVTDTDITLKYYGAPPSGTDNLVWDIVTIAPETSAIQQRKEAYQQGPSVEAPTLLAESASAASDGEAEFSEAFASLRDGWRCEIFAAGAGDDDGSVPSEARVVSATDPASDGTYVTEYTTTGVDEVPTDGSGNIDYSSTLATIDNTSGGPMHLFFRAVNADSGSSEVHVWGAWTIVRRPIP
jgi:hypothetical protein